MAARVNVEALVLAHLRADPGVAARVDQRVYTSFPAKTTWPAARVVRYGGPVLVPGTLDEARLQIDAYAATKQAAFDLAALITTAVEALPGAHPGHGFVTGADVTDMSWRPDETHDPALAGYSLDVTVWAARLISRDDG